MKKLNTLIARLETNIRDQDLMNASISKASVGWHIEHALLTLDFIIDALSKSNPDDYKKTFDFRRTVVIVFGIIPRGRIKAPRAVQPATHFNSDTLQQHIFHSEKKINTIANLNPGHYFKHPFLGDFKLKTAIRFIQVHTHHHLTIIDDIVKSKKQV